MRANVRKRNFVKKINGKYIQAPKSYVNALKMHSNANAETYNNRGGIVVGGLRPDCMGTCNFPPRMEQLINPFVTSTLVGLIHTRGSRVRLLLLCISQKNVFQGCIFPNRNTLQTCVNTTWWIEIYWEIIIPETHKKSTENVQWMHALRTRSNAHAETYNKRRDCGGGKGCDLTACGLVISLQVILQYERTGEKHIPLSCLSAPERTVYVHERANATW